MYEHLTQANELALLIYGSGTWQWWSPLVLLVLFWAIGNGIMALVFESRDVGTFSELLHEPLTMPLTALAGLSMMANMFVPLAVPVSAWSLVLLAQSTDIPMSAALVSAGLLVANWLAFWWYLLPPGLRSRVC